jgi:hypothetical protein
MKIFCNISPFPRLEIELAVQMYCLLGTSLVLLLLKLHANLKLLSSSLGKNFQYFNF